MYTTRGMAGQRKQCESEKERQAIAQSKTEPIRDGARERKIHKKDREININKKTEDYMRANGDCNPTNRKNCICTL